MMADPIVVRLTTPVRGYPVGAEFGFTDATQATSVLGAGTFEVVREQDGDWVTPPTPEELEQWELDAIALARARRLITGADFDALIASSGTTTFNANGSITTTPARGATETVTFNADGSITTVYGAPLSKMIRTTFAGDTITEATL